jgi:hypothetical protein
MGAKPTARRGRALELETGTSNEFALPCKAVGVAPSFRPESKIQNGCRRSARAASPSLPRRVSLARKGTLRSTKTSSITVDFGEPFRDQGAEVRDNLSCRCTSVGTVTSNGFQPATVTSTSKSYPFASASPMPVRLSSVRSMCTRTAACAKQCLTQSRH